MSFYAGSIFVSPVLRSENSSSHILLGLLLPPLSLWWKGLGSPGNKQLEGSAEAHTYGSLQELEGAQGQDATLRVDFFQTGF